MPAFLYVAFAFYLLATSLGVLLRLYLLQPFQGLVFPHALHAHSHTLYFGWVGLAVFALAFRRLGAADRAVKAMLVAIALLSVATFAAFLHGGYGPAGMAVSGLALPVWWTAGGLWLRRARGRQGIDLAFLRVAVVYMIVAGFGAVGRVAVLVAKVADPFWGRLAVFAFLENFAWFFVFAVIGLLAAEAPRMGLRLDAGRMRRILLWMAPLAWMTFPLGVQGGADSVLGIPARLAAAALAYPSFLWVRELWRGSAGAPAVTRAALRWLAVWYALKAGMELSGAFGLAETAVRLRQPAILYLHVLLLGFVTLALVVLTLRALQRPLALGLALHNLGLAVMSAGLGLATVAGWWPDAFGTLLPRALFIATVGGVALVAAAIAWLLPRGVGGGRAG